MNTSQDSAHGKQGLQSYPAQIQALVKKLATTILLHLPEADRPNPEPFMAYYSERMKKSVNEEDGIRSLPLFSLKTAKWVFSNWTPWENDVIIASYYKTGSTWVYTIAKEILYKDEPKIKEMLRDFGVNRYLENSVEQKYEVFEKLPWKRRALATHLCEELLNVKKITEAGAKIIYLMRNPKDQMVSLYHMIENLPSSSGIAKELIGDGWNEFFNKVITGKMPTLQKDNEWYPDHLLGWIKHRKNNSVLFVTYEDIKIVK